MKVILSTNEVINELRRDKFAGWSYNGAKALAEYLEEYEESTGEKLQFDPVALRCEFSEYESFNEFAKEFWDDDCHLYWASDNVIRNFIQDRTTLIEFDGGILVQNF
jgi:hypothetical protein